MLKNPYIDPTIALKTTKEDVFEPLYILII
jgi:hypothetical protein